MRAVDSIALAGTQLVRRRLRSFLCALSVAVGVSSMVLIAALGVCGQREVRTRVDSLGLSGLTVYVSESAPGQQMTEKYAAMLTRNVPEVAHAMALKVSSGSYRTSSTSGNAVFFGVTEELQNVVSLELVAGAMPTEQQISHSEPVAMVDDELAKTLYGRENIIGKQIRFTIDGSERYFKVCGVVRQQTSAFGSVIGSLVPAMVYVPYGCLAGPTDSADQIMVQCIAGVEASEAGEKITAYLSGRGQVAGKLSVQDMGGTLGLVEDAVTIATKLFVAVAAISFLVAMLGVLSGMLSAAHEKKSEIGLYMALGARKSDIARLFLTQAMLISLAGSAAGLIVVSIVLFVASAALHISLTVPPLLAAAALGLSALCGALAGALPAVHAAGLHPVEAMRK